MVNGELCPSSLPSPLFCVGFRNAFGIGHEVLQVGQVLHPLVEQSNAPMYVGAEMIIQLLALDVEPVPLAPLFK